MRHTFSALGFLFLLLIILSHVYAQNGEEMSIAEKQSFGSGDDEKKEVGGRKMYHNKKVEIEEHKIGSHGGDDTKVISAAGRRYDNHNNNNIGSHPQFIHQELKKSKKWQLNSGILGSPRQDKLNIITTKTQEYEESKAKQKVENQRRLAEEIVNLMHKDYKGVERPRRKPPINNRVPIH